MRIISDFSDIYDLQHTMFDKDRVWIRNTEEVVIRAEKSLCGRFPYRTRSASFRMGWFYFCGDVYPMLSANSIEKSVTGIGLDPFLAKLAAAEWSHLLESVSILGNSVLTEIKQVIANNSPEVKKLFDSFDAPLGLMYERKQLPSEADTQEVLCHVLELNPQLNPSLPWADVDSNIYRMHQHLEQYLSGVLAGFGRSNEPLVTTSDKDLLLSKGFDYKTSFRKAKQS